MNSAGQDHLHDNPGVPLICTLNWLYCSFATLDQGILVFGWCLSPLDADATVDVAE